MKIEIDTSNKESLLKQEIELSTCLAIVRKALSMFSKSTNIEQEEKLKEVINSLGSNFTTTEAIKNAVSRGFSGAATRICIYNMLCKGELIIHTKGMGRSPTIYSKIK